VLIVVGHSHFFRTMFQRFLHADVLRRAPELAARLKQVAGWGVRVGA